MRNQSRGRGVFEVGALALILIAATLAAAGPSLAGKGKWAFRFEPVITEIHGHDQHVLTIHEFDFDATPELENRTAVNLDTDGGTALHFQGEYSREKWGWGVDLFWLRTKQGTPDRSAAADGAGGSIDEVVFEVADETFNSTDPGEVLFYRVLEDTDFLVWTVDFYGARRLFESEDRSIRMRLGLRLGDLDNDYRAVVGVEGVGGRRLDGSSNYGRMMGPMIGFSGDIRFGRSTLSGYFGQSVMIGDVELTGIGTDFTGPYDTATFTEQERFNADLEVAIPVTEFRIQWSYELTKKISLGAGANASAWWDATVPPGVIPVEDGDTTIHENTIVFIGLAAGVELRF